MAESMLEKEIVDERPIYLIHLFDYNCPSCASGVTNVFVDGTFMKLKHDNPEFSQWDLLNYFYENVLVRMTDSSFLMNKRYRKS